MILPAISIRQPWTWAILHAGKDVENRSWKLPKKYTNRAILLHTGKRIDREAVTHLLHLGFDVPEKMEAGGIVGMVVFTGFTGCCGPDSDWAEKGLYLQWRIGKSQALPFFPCPGRLSFFEVDYPYEVPS